MVVEKTVLKTLYCVRLNPGDDILLCLREAVEKQGIKNAVILSGVGSVTSHHFHVVASLVNPPREKFTKGEKPSDIVNVNGFIINGRVHAHIIHSDKDVAFGGHLELGVKVLTFSAITIAEVDHNFDKWDSIGNIEELLKAY
jgi:predicted DNA-binding protein with PD1-like motif